MAKKSTPAVPTAKPNITAAELDKAKQRLIDLRGKVEHATREWEQGRSELKEKTRQFLRESGLTDLFSSTSTKGKAKSSDTAGRWRDTLVSALLAERPQGWTKEELLAEMEARKPGANTKKLDTYLKSAATEKGGRFVAKKSK
jgi:hypothetical protein